MAVCRSGSLTFLSTALKMKTTLTTLNVTFITFWTRGKKPKQKQKKHTTCSVCACGQILYITTLLFHGGGVRVYSYALLFQP